MTGLTRRAFTIASAATVGATMLGRTARAADFTFKYASNLAATHPMNVRMQAAADAIKKESNGKLEMQIFANSQLGGDLEVLSQLRSGAIQLVAMAGAQMSTLVPVASMNGVGFAFTDMDQVWKAMDGELGALVRGAIQKVGLHVYDKMFDNGFRQITSGDKPVQAPADLAGLTIRVPPSALSTSLFKAFGASPQSINFGETYTALQTHLVAAQENPLPLIESAKFYEVQKYVSMTNHMWDGFWIIGNADAIKGLPADLAALVAKHFDAAVLGERDDITKLNASIIEQLKAKGMNFVEPDRAAFRAALNKTSFYEDWKKRFGDANWAVLEKYTGKLG
jgi:tripartite ATP-independent transporter DctP family solute receptor